MSKWFIYIFIHTAFKDRLYILTSSEDGNIRAYSLINTQMSWRPFLSTIVEGHISAVKCLAAPKSKHLKDLVKLSKGKKDSMM
jgi:hypothetical protein